MSHDPTAAIVSRYEAWIKVVNTFEKYLTAAAVRYDWIQEATRHLSSEMPQPEDLGDQFAPAGSGGIKDIFVKLWWDLLLPDGKAAESASAIIKDDLLKEVEALKRDLSSSISNFNELSGSFDTGLAPSKTASLRDPRLNTKIDEYVRAVSLAESGKQPEVDPYLLKLELDRKIDRIVRKHNTQADRYAYVQEDVKRLDAEISERMQTLIRRYTDIAERNGRIIAGGALAVRSVFVNQPKLFEYKHWLQSQHAPETFSGTAGEDVKTHKSDSDLGYPKEGSVYSKAVRTGSLERRTKILRTYSPGDYVLTPQSLIEIRQNRPVWSIDLIGAKLLEDHKANSDDQFVIEAKQHGSSSGRLHKFIFRAKVPANWKRDIGAICAGGIPPSLADIATAQNSGPEPHGDSKPTVVVPPAGPAPASAVSGPAGGPAPAYKAADVKPPVAAPVAATAPAPVASPVPAPVAAATAAPVAATTAAPAPTATKEPSDINPNAAAQQFSGLSIQDTKPEPPVAAAGTVPASNPFSSSKSVARSDEAAAGITPMSTTPASISVKDTPPPPTMPVTLKEGSTEEQVRDYEDDDSDVSDVTESYNGLDDEEDYTLARKAKEDMAIFDKPVGAVGLEEQSREAASATHAEGNPDVWYYDAKHKDEGNTFKNDTDFKPPDADLSVEAERKLSRTEHKLEAPSTHIVTRDQADAAETPEGILQQRRSSVTAGGGQKRKNSRKATGSYGGEDIAGLKPLSNMTQEDKDAALKKSEESPLFFSEGLPSSTTGKQL